MDGKRVSGNYMLPTWLDDDNDIFIICLKVAVEPIGLFIYLFKTVFAIFIVHCTEKKRNSLFLYISLLMKTPNIEHQEK